MTAVHLDGTLMGPAVEEIRAVAEAAGLHFIYAGGIGSEADVLKVRDRGGPSCRGVIAGKAVYDGRLDLGRALRALEKSH
jgi:phosphoribosylformimino-5-aminoimidazole carboxamide ribotide isomerase